MPIRIPVSELKNAVKLLKRVVPARASVPVLTHVKFTTNPPVQPGIVIEGTNLDETLKVHVNADVSDDCQDFCIPLSELADVLKGLKAGDTVKLDSTTAPGSVLVGFTVGGSQIERCIDTISIEEWPDTMDISDEEQSTITVDGQFFCSYRHAATLASKDATRQVLNHVCIDRENIAAGDGRVQVALAHGVTVGKEFLLPVSKVLLAKEMFADGATVHVYDKSELCVITDERVAYTTKLYQGTYPNYRQVFPGVDPEDRIIALADCSDVVNAVQQFHTSDKTNKPITMLSSEHGSHLIGEGDSPEVIAVNAEVKGPKKPVAVTMNRDYLLYLLNAGFKQLRIKGDTRPILAVNGESRLVCMPMRGGRSVEQCLKLIGRESAVAQEPVEQPAEPTPVDKPEPTTQKAEPVADVEQKSEPEHEPQPQEKTPMPEQTIQKPAPQEAASEKAPEPAPAPKPDLKVVNAPESVDPFDELLEFTNELADKTRELNNQLKELPRKVRALKSNLKQKDKAFAQAQVAMEQLRKVAGF